MITDITDEILRDLPQGVTYHPPGTEEAQDTIGQGDENADVDVVRCGNFSINIEMVTKPQIISMRKYLPSEEYRLLKNRKTARLCRRKRKQERNETTETLKSLQDANLELKKQLEKQKRLLKEKDQVIEAMKKQNKLHEEKIASLQSIINNAVGTSKETKASNEQVIDNLKPQVDLNTIKPSILASALLSANNMTDKHTGFGSQHWRISPLNRDQSLNKSPRHMFKDNSIN